MMAEDHNYAELQENANTTTPKSTSAFDQVLLDQLKKIRKKVATQKFYSTFCCFSRFKFR